MDSTPYFGQGVATAPLPVVPFCKAVKVLVINVPAEPSELGVLVLFDTASPPDFEHRKRFFFSGVLSFAPHVREVIFVLSKAPGG